MAAKQPHIEVYHKIGTAGERFLMHMHNKFEIYVSVSGNSKYFIDQRIYDVRPYDVFLFNDRDMHRIHPNDEEHYERYVIMFPPEELLGIDPTVKVLLAPFSAGASKRQKLTLPSDKREQALTLIRRFIDCDGSDPFRTLRQTVCLIELLLVLNEISATAADISSPSETSDARIDAVMRYLRENYAEHITLDALAKRFWLNKFYLCRLFKKKLGIGINGFLEACRLSNAMPLLAEGRSVSEVARITGFGSDAYFIDVFRNTFGVSPKKYIKQLLRL